jgi:hypothetical protein
VLRWHPLQFHGGLTSGRRPVVKIIAESLSQLDEKHVVPTVPVKGRKKKKYNRWSYRYRAMPTIRLATRRMGHNLPRGPVRVGGS